MFQMERLHASAYMSKWYEEKPKVRRDLLILLTITSKNIDLNYRHFISYNYACYAMVNTCFVQFIESIFYIDLFRLNVWQTSFHRPI